MPRVAQILPQVKVKPAKSIPESMKSRRFLPPVESMQNVSPNRHFRKNKGVVEIYNAAGVKVARFGPKDQYHSPSSIALESKKYLSNTSNQSSNRDDIMRVNLMKMGQSSSGVLDVDSSGAGTFQVIQPNRKNMLKMLIRDPSLQSETVESRSISGRRNMNMNMSGNVIIEDED